MALVRVYCGLASADRAGRPAQAGTSLTAAVVDDAGRLLDVCEVGDDAAGYAQLCTVLAERSGGPTTVAIAADSDDHQVTMLLTAAGRALAIADDDSVDDYAERFADDESADEMESPPAERRAVGLARALQAGALSAVSLPAPRDLAGLKGVLVAHAALTTGRHSAAVALREVLRELHPAALRAYPDPAEPVPLAVLDALPEPYSLGSVPAGPGRDGPATDAIVTELSDTGVADPATVQEAITALHVAITETPRRGATNKALNAAISQTIRQAVAAVRACDAACDALVTTLTERIGAPQPAHPPMTRRAPASAAVSVPVPAPATVKPAIPVPPRPAVAEPVAPRGPAREPVEPPAPRRTRPQPAPGTAVPPPRPLAPPPVAPTPVAPSRVAPPPIAPAAAAVTRTTPPAPVLTPRAPVASSTVPPPVAAPATVLPAGPAVPASPPPPSGSTPPSPDPRGPLPPPPVEAGEPFRPTLTTAAMNSARAARAAVEASLGRPAAGRHGDQPAGREPSARYSATDYAVPVPPPRPDSPAPGSRANWPLTGSGDDLAAGPGAGRDMPFTFGDLPSELDRPVAELDQPVAGRGQPSEPSRPAPPTGSAGSPASPPAKRAQPSTSSRNGRVTPPWQADDLPPEPPMLRLVEPPLAGRAPREDPTGSKDPASGDELTSSGDRSGAELGAPADLPLDPPPLRLVEPEPAEAAGSWPPGRENATTSRRNLTRRTGERPAAGPPGAGRHVPAAEAPDLGRYAAREQVASLPAAPLPATEEGDGDLLIFAQARSAWFVGHSKEEPDWVSMADFGWRAAEQASRPAVGAETIAGLPKRVPQANLVPGSPITSPDRPPLRISRDPASIAEHTSGYFDGWRRGQEINGYAVGGRPGRESALGWDFSRDHGGRDDEEEYGYHSAGHRA